MTSPEAPLEPPTSSPLVQHPTQLRFSDDDSATDSDEDAQEAFQPPVVVHQPDATHWHFPDTSTDDEAQEATPALPIALPPALPIALPPVLPSASQPDGEIDLSIAARDLCKTFAPARTKTRQLDPPLNWRISVTKVEAWYQLTKELQQEEKKKWTELRRRISKRESPE
jgi:hypothetical protein